MFDHQLINNRFVAGDRISVADITALCSIDFAKGLDVGVPGEYRDLNRWYEFMCARPSAKA
jgi:glutathione S-transferase